MTLKDWLQLLGPYVAIIVAVCSVLGIIITAEYSRRKDKKQAQAAQIDKNTASVVGLEVARIQDQRLLMQDLQHENKDLRDRVSELERLMREVIKSSADDRIKLNGEVAVLSADVRLLTGQLKHVTEERDGLRNRVRDLENEVAGLKRYNTQSSQP